MNVRHVRPGLLEQRGHLEVGGDVFLAGRRVHDDEGVGLRRPGGRIDVAARHTEIAAEAGVSGCHADSADAPSQVARQPGPDERESRVVLEHSYKYSAQMARETSTAPLLLVLAISQLFTRHRPWPTSGLPRHAPRPKRLRRRQPAADTPADPSTSQSPSRPTTRTSISTSTATPCCRATSSCARATRSSAPTAWNTTRRPGSAKVTGAVEFSSPALKVRGSSGEYSPALGAQFEGAQFELPAAQRARRGAQHEGGRRTTR